MPCHVCLDLEKNSFVISQEGRALFAEALAQGGLDGSYWDLSENFVTQHEPVRHKSQDCDDLDICCLL